MRGRGERSRGLFTGTRGEVLVLGSAFVESFVAFVVEWWGMVDRRHMESSGGAVFCLSTRSEGMYRRVEEGLVLVCEISN